MNRVLLALLNLIFISYLLVISILYELLFMPLFIIYFLLSGRGRLDDAFRVHNYIFGWLITRASWPYIRTSSSGAGNARGISPCVLVLNHPSFADVFFASYIPISNQMAIVRNWVFEIKLLGWAMRLAGYLNADKINLEEMISYGKELSKRQVSFQFYPEGHRSRDGKLQRFRNGAFYLATECELPVLPVCIFGLEKLSTRKFPYLKPARIHVKILEPIYPENYRGEHRAIELRKDVRDIFEEELKNEYFRNN